MLAASAYPESVGFQVRFLRHILLQNKDNLEFLVCWAWPGILFCRPLNTYAREGDPRARRPYASPRACRPGGLIWQEARSGLAADRSAD